MISARAWGRTKDASIGSTREVELSEVYAAAKPKRVVVVGGGVAGLEAARMAAARGHRVVLFEKAAELGGQVLLAARAPARAEYAGIVRFLVAQVRKLAVNVRLDVEATASAVLAERPDAVIVATGSHPYIPPVPGCDGKHVVTDRDVLCGEATVGASVVVVDDVHTQEALSTAELLLEQGKRVEVISPLFYVGQDIGVTSIAPLYRRLHTRGTSIQASSGTSSPSTQLCWRPEAARRTASTARSKARSPSSMRRATASLRAASTRPSSTAHAWRGRSDGDVLACRVDDVSVSSTGSTPGWG